MATIFKLNPEPTFRAIIAIPSAGVAEGMELDIEFKRKTKDELAKYYSEIKGKKDLDALLEIMAGWHNCDAEFSKKALAALLQNYPAAASTIVNRYGAESIGARLGN